MKSAWLVLGQKVKLRNFRYQTSMNSSRLRKEVISDAEIKWPAREFTSSAFILYALLLDVEHCSWFILLLYLLVPHHGPVFVESVELGFVDENRLKVTLQEVFVEGRAQPRPSPTEVTANVLEEHVPFGLVAAQEFLDAWPKRCASSRWKRGICECKLFMIVVLSLQVTGTSIAKYTRIIKNCGRLTKQTV